MLNNKFRARQFAPNPMDYMKHKIERLREDLITAEQKPASLPRCSILDDLPHKIPSPFTTSEEIEDYSDDELSSEAEARDLLTASNSPLLPLHKSDLQDRELSATSRVHFFLKQPITILLFAAVVFIPSSTALAILDRFNLYQATYKFPFPLALLYCQLLFSELILLAWTLISHQLTRWRPDWSGTVGLIENVTWDYSMAKSLAPVSMSYLLAGAAFISCLEYVPMEFALLFLSPMMLCQLALSKFFNPENTQSAYIAISCLLLMIGHGLACFSAPSAGLPSYNFQGLLAGLVASVAMPVSNSLVKKHLPRLNYHSMQMLHYILSGAILMGPTSSRHHWRNL